MAILDEIARGAEAAGRRRDRDLLLIPDRRAAIADGIGARAAGRHRAARRQGPRAVDHRRLEAAALGRASGGRRRARRHGLHRGDAGGPRPRVSPRGCLSRCSRLRRDRRSRCCGSRCRRWPAGSPARRSEAAGVHGTDTRVDVGADPPLKLLLLDADRVRVRSTDANIRTCTRMRSTCTLRGVSIARRPFDSIEGTLTGVTFTPETGAPVPARTGAAQRPAEAARVTITLERARSRSCVASAVATATGQPVSDVTLARRTG